MTDTVHTRNSSHDWQRAWTRFNECCQRLHELAKQDGDVDLKIDVRLKVGKKKAHKSDEKDVAS